MSQRWSLAELTEFDLRLRDADRNVIALDTPSSTGKTRSDLLRQWLRLIGNPDDKLTQLSKTAVRTEAWFRLGICLISLFLGGGAASALLHYGGERLINVSAYLGVLVGGQLLSLLVLAFSVVWLRSRLGVLEEILLPKLLRDCSSPESLTAWRWRLFTSFQLGGISLNLGILLATIWRVVTSDLAFGWATTLNADPEAISTLIQTLSAPWGGTFAPTSEQIAASRIVLLEGFSNVDTASTAAWWPFLMMCVGFYGLLPRVLLTGFGAFHFHRNLSSPSFSSPEAEQLIQRLRRPPLGYQYGKESPKPSSNPAPGIPALQPTQPMRVDIPAELSEQLDLDALSEAIEKTYGITLSKDLEETGTLFVIEIWQPPIAETLRFFRSRREQEGSGAEFLVLAVGTPRGPADFHPPSEQDLAIWRAKLSELKDPLLGLIPWEETR